MRESSRGIISKANMLREVERQEEEQMYLAGGRKAGWQSSGWLVVEDDTQLSRIETDQ